MTKLFQSYLIVGREDERRAKTKVLAARLKFDPKRNRADFFEVSALKDSISIDQIRDLKGHIYKKPLTGLYKLIIIESAEKLTQEAQNALLKILEEPPSHAIIILGAANKTSLLPTIVSRVTTIHAPHEAKSESTSDLMISGGISEKLLKLSEVEDPKAYLNEQMITLYNLLLDRASDDKTDDRSPLELATQIEKCVRIKEMIEANVNPKFALLSLAI